VEPLRSIKIFSNHTGTIKDLYSDTRGKHELFDHKYSTSKQTKQVLRPAPGKETMFKLPKIKMPDVKGTIKKVKDSTVNATKKATDAVRDQAKKANPFKKNK
jgi:hypothetical protein